MDILHHNNNTPLRSSTRKLPAGLAVSACADRNTDRTAGQARNLPTTADTADLLRSPTAMATRTHLLRNLAMDMVHRLLALLHHRNTHLKVGTRSPNAL